MIDRARNWFAGLSQREQVLIGIAGLLLAGLIGYYAIARPMSEALTAAELRYVGAVERQARIEAKVAALQQPSGGTASKFSGAIDVFVSQSAGETGIAVGSIDSQADGRVNMVVTSARPTALFGWLARIEGEGVAVESLNVIPAGSGTVSATLTLRAQ